jgi:hypothetical protein
MTHRVVPGLKSAVGPVDSDDIHVLLFSRVRRVSGAAIRINSPQSVCQLMERTTPNFMDTGRTVYLM